MFKRSHDARRISHSSEVTARVKPTAFVELK